ncbi:PASTA domain-containing protein [Nocardioides houyundeii]|uniref:PASTA domain-containing protein n=1 Tax=Nocardioides houyundeii TaxID=2045452 RepID=UPI000DF313F6|nr:PASTA domain-containing protein [Nocardioides houyundeii]
MRNLITAATLLALAVPLSSCGEDEPLVMPELVGKRLDIALSDVERAGFEDEVEVLGGGTFGVLDESNWTVCSQEPAEGDEISAAPRISVDRSCDSEDGLDPEASEPEGEQSASPEESAAAKATPSVKPAQKQKRKKKAPAPAPETFTMPSLVGMVLQDAQDALQSLGSYLLTQTDGTGQSRFQVLDSGWKVCAQDPAPGAVTDIATLVELVAVKLEETC